MEEAPENSKELLRSGHVNGMRNVSNHEFLGKPQLPDTVKPV
jgi:hypothetical protein